MPSLSNPLALATGSKAATRLVIAEASSVFIQPGTFQVEVGGGATATWKIVRTTDDPASSPTWHNAEDQNATITNTVGRSIVCEEAAGGYYNIEITAYTSGTLTARVEQGKGAVS